MMPGGDKVQIRSILELQSGDIVRAEKPTALIIDPFDKVVVGEAVVNVYGQVTVNGKRVRDQKWETGVNPGQTAHLRFISAERPVCDPSLPRAVGSVIAVHELDSITYDPPVFVALNAKGKWVELASTKTVPIHKVSVWSHASMTAEYAQHRL